MKPLGRVLLALAVATSVGRGAGRAIGGTSTAAPIPMVRFGFDGTTKARRADGTTVEPLEAQGVRFTEGITGRALLAEDGIVLRYPRRLMSLKAGSVAMWIRLTRPAGEGGWRFLFGSGEGWGVCGTPRVWLYAGKQLRCDLTCGAKHAVYAGADWPVGQWNHLVFTWDVAKGQTAVYINGQAQRPPKTVEPWPIPKSESFRIGSNTDIPGRGNLPAYAAIDEVFIYDRALSQADCGAVLVGMQLPIVRFRALRPVVEPRNKIAPFLLTNIGGRKASGTVSWTIGQRRMSRAFDLAPQQQLQVDIDVEGLGPGLRRIPFSFTGVPTVAHGTIRLPIFIRRQGPPPDQPIPWRKVGQVDCAKRPPDSVVGPTEVVESPIGAYLEAGPKLGDRFVYSFRLSGPERLVRATVTYPDDKIRTASVTAWGPPQEALGSGFSTGEMVPLTKAMANRAFVFFSRNQHLGLVISTEADGQPAAAARIIVEEAPPQLSPAAPKPAIEAQNHRRMGLYWEDPVLPRCFGEPDSTNPAEFENVLTRCLDYCDWIGLDAIIYPGMWYDGPIYNSPLNDGWPYGGRLHPADLLTIMADRCQQRDIAYRPSVRTWKLLSLAGLLLDEAEVIAGRPNVNGVSRTGRISTWDNYTWNRHTPLINIHHPQAQEAAKAAVLEMVRLCREYRSFAAVDLMLRIDCFYKPGSIPLTDSEGSYDDYCVGEFAKHIGQVPPGVIGDKDRFVRRYHWINDDPQRKAAWLRWRADRMTEFYRSLAKDMASIKPGVKLGLVVCYPEGSPEDTIQDPDEMMLAMGIDLDGLSPDPNIQIQRVVHQMLMRWAPRHDYARPKDLNRNNARSFQAPFAGIPNMGAIFHQQYFETWVPRTRGLLELPAPFPSEREGLKFNSGCRVSEPLHSGRDALRYYAYAVRNFDATLITVGGYVLGTQGIEPELREFARAFTALPAVRFKTVIDTDEYVVRTAPAEGKSWVYIVSLSPRDQTIDVTPPSGRPYNAATGGPIELGKGKVRLRLRPYELVSLVGK